MIPAALGREVMYALAIVGIVLLALFGLVFLVLFARYFKLWLRGFVTRAGIGPHSLVFMSLRKVNPNVIVEGKITAVQAGLPNIPTGAIEAHYLAGGNVRNVIRAMIAAQRAKIDLDWQTATAIDLAGRNVLEAVQTSVDPKVIDCPDPRRHGRNTLDGIAKDGIQLKTRARVTVRTNIKQLIGGATEETVIARVGEGIVSAIGSCESHKMVLANPALITQAVLKKGLDSQTAYEIVSIDIADIDVGDNVGARLQADQAEADVRIARAKAEERRAMAVALEQEMKASTQESRAHVVLAEAEIPRAISEAYRQGHLRADVERRGGGNGVAAGRG
ncbi:MAG: flotillin-like protein FloA [Planctomycetaceae bacterium]|nr:flotillin-like protein FloA [Planctomycetaceae bacterium]